MFPVPIDDNVHRRTFWFCVLAIIVANCWMFLYVELPLPHRALDSLVLIYGIVPARYLGVHPFPSPAGLVAPIFVSMFLHGGWMHLLGNMLFLYTFGRSVEDRFGHSKFLLLYFAGGLGGAGLHIFFNAGSRVPSIGASGAIAGVMGAYFVCFPRARISTFLMPFFFWTFELPAVFVLGYWFVIQFSTGFFHALEIETASQQGGVAWWAHVGGFVVGMALALMLKPRAPRVEIYSPL